MMSTARTVAVFAIIVGCFAVLYPRLFHPFVVRLFGGHKPSGSEVPLHPPGHGRRPDMRKPGEGEDIRSHIRPGPHPGLRAAAEMRQQQQQQGGGGRGMMGVVLPMYAVGIVLYLIYTIVKVFSKRQESQRSESERPSQFRDFSYEQREDKFTFGDDFDGEDDYKEFMSKRQKQKELEKLLLKADDRHISESLSEYEMRQLQKRLEETEAQMSRILQAMQTVTEKVDEQGTSEGSGKQEKSQNDQKPQAAPPATDKAQSKDPKDISDTEDKGDKSVDSTPDTDSFEVVSKTGSSSFSVISTPTDEDAPPIPPSEATESSDHTQKAANSNSSLWEEFEKAVPEDDIAVLSTCKANTDGIEVENLGAFTEDIVVDKENKETEESSVRQRKPNPL
ncbi:resistance to inhibitors of cholinesterase protein 3-like isoform X2 [Liolophura sinensis]|uniref:resistance to inhibitors of cholinesterase protein 3-like isoform X2 n=1 Tax=Liolophura sinensis TaxID=3198878 RepID=UPI0031591454